VATTTGEMSVGGVAVAAMKGGSLRAFIASIESRDLWASHFELAGWWELRKVKEWSE